jgi:hypothetical protein
MFNTVVRFFSFMAIIAAFSIAATAQSTTGTVTITGTVSKYVELTSGGPATITGTSGGIVTTAGTANSPLAVVVNLGELGPTNTSSFAVATVPLRLRSNAAYVLSAAAVVNTTTVGTPSTANRITASDIGFGIANITRSGVGVATGTDTNATPGDPTTATSAIDATSGRFTFTAANGTLNAFATSKTAFSGTTIMNAVPLSNTLGLTANAIFAIKPQFYETGSTTATVTFTVTAP